METNSKTGGMSPSASALIDLLNQKPNTSSDPTMLTPSQRELLLRAQTEIDEWFEQSAHLFGLPEPLQPANANATEAVTIQAESAMPEQRDQKHFEPVAQRLAA